LIGKKGIRYKTNFLSTSSESLRTNRKSKKQRLFNRNFIINTESARI